MGSLLKTLFRDENAMAAEFALVLPLLLLFTIGVLDIGYYAYTVNQGEKATQIGARFAAVTDPLASEIATASYVNTNAGGMLITQGSRIPAEAFGQLRCVSTGCTCVNGPCPGTTFNNAAFTNLRTRMQQIMPLIAAEDIEVTYSGSGLGYAGNPNGPDISPIITVRLQNMEYTPIALLIFGANVGLPDFSYSLTAEDNAGGQSN